MIELLEREDIGIEAGSAETCVGNIKKSVSIEQTLVKLGVKPFSEVSVERYKGKKEKMEGPFFLTRILLEWEKFPGVFSMVGVSTAALGMIALLTAFVSAFFFGLCHHFGHIATFLKICGLVSGLIFVAMIPVIMTLCLLEQYFSKQELAEWKSHPLHYTATLPPEVRNLVHGVLYHKPDAIFTLDELTYRNVIVDPFVAVQGYPNGKKYYIAVYDESFELIA